MEQLIKLVRTYRLTSGLADRLQLAEQIFYLIEPNLRTFVFGKVHSQDVNDVLQVTLSAIITGLGGFQGNSNQEFWGWCYRIASNKVSDHYRKAGPNRLEFLGDDELLIAIEAASEISPLSLADKIDLEYAMQLLSAAKPECRDYLWQHYVIGLDYTEIAQERELKYDAVRMKIGRCLDEIKSLIA